MKKRISWGNAFVLALAILAGFAAPVMAEGPAKARDVCRQLLIDLGILSTSGTYTAGVSSSRAIVVSGPLTGGGTLASDVTIALGTVPATQGGTGQTTYARGDMLVATGVSTLSKTTIGAANKVWHSDGTDPSWQALVAADIPAACTNVTSLGTLTGLKVSGGLGVNGTSATPANGNSVFNNTGAVIAQNATNGFVYVPICATGAPNGTPTAFTGAAPIVLGGDNVLYYYVAGSTNAWLSTRSSTPTLFQVLTAGNSSSGAGLVVSSGDTLTLTGATITGAPTWSSNQAITLSTAAQPNVTSLGTLTGLTTAGTGQHTWNTGGSPSATASQILGPTDTDFFVSAPSGASGTLPGRGIYFTAGSGAPISGTSAGGLLSFTAGNGNGGGGLGGAISFTSGSAVAGNADKAAGSFTFATGAGTGAGSEQILFRAGFLAGSTNAQVVYDRINITSKTFTCSTTSATANTFLLISNAVSNSGVAAEIQYTLEVGDGSNHWSTIGGSMWVSGSNRNGTVTATCTTAGTGNQSISDTTTFTSLASTTTATVSGTNIQCKVTPSWAAGTPTTVRITYQVRLSGQGNATPQ